PRSARGARRRAGSDEPVANADGEVEVEVRVPAHEVPVEVERRHDLDEDVERDIIEVERDADRDANPEQARVGAHTPGIAGVVEVPEPSADADVERQLERLGLREHERMPQVVGVDMKAASDAVDVVALVEVTDAEVDRVTRCEEHLAGEPGEI